MKHDRAKQSRGFGPSGCRIGGSMETMNERYDKGWEILRSNMREDSAILREDMAKRDAELARRDTTNTRWLVGVIIAATAIIIAFVLSSN